MPLVDVKDNFDGGSGDIDGRVPDQIAGATTWQKLPGLYPGDSTTGPVVQELGTAAGLDGPAGGAAPALYVVGSPRTPNYRVKSNVQGVNSGGFVGLAGVVARAIDKSNFYAWYRSTTSAQNFVLTRMVGGTLTNLYVEAGSSAPFASLLELVVIGSQLTAYSDGVQKFQVTDTSLPAAGKAGFYIGTSNVAGTAARVHDYEAVDLLNPVRSAV